MRKALKIGFKHLVLFYIGAIAYVCIEYIYRGYSHWTMGILGGLCFIFLGGINEFLSWGTPFWKQCIFGAMIVTILEYITGCVVNIWLGWNVWDYSNLPFSLHGQINLFFSMAWCFLSAIAIVLDDWLRYWLFKEEKPHYKWM